MENAIKYPKTYHLPFSKGLQNDDRRLEDINCFDGKTVAVTVKMDGENTTMYRDGIHARSLYSMSHPSQHWIKAYHGQIKHLIPKGWRVCGENLYARHSIAYENLKHFFQVFNIWNKHNEAFSYEDTVLWCKRNGIHHVRTLAIVEIQNGDFSEVEEVFNNAVQQGEEGVVIRVLDSFKFEDFQRSVAKAVRKNHVQTDEHWTKTWVPNKLIDGVQI